MNSVWSRMFVSIRNSVTSLLPVLFLFSAGFMLLFCCVVAVLFLLVRRKGKEVDGETQVAIDKLQESIEKSDEAAKETFHSLFGKESPTPRSSTSTYAPAHLKVRNENDHNQDDDLYGDQDDDDL
ncbi:hypothetical protein P8452_47173 [Trifolium repens]|nr:hypothetical protein P8452_47173 [Trifolium repens]